MVELLMSMQPKLYGLVAARLLPLGILLPLAFHATHARRWSVGVTAMMALLIAPLHRVPAGLEGSDPQQHFAVFGYELLLGLALGTGFAFLLAGLQITGALLAQLSGLTWADQADPTTSWQGETGVQRYFTMLAFAIFLVSGGHRAMLQTLLESFSRIPPGTWTANIDASRLLMDLLAHSLQLGIRVAAPIAFCLMVSTFILAILARAAPYMGALGMGVGINLMVLLLVTCASLETIANVYQSQWIVGLDRLACLWTGEVN
jgi:flagellar biosynthesis protein FliR